MPVHSSSPNDPAPHRPWGAPAPGRSRSPRALPAVPTTSASTSAPALFSQAPQQTPSPLPSQLPVVHKTHSTARSRAAKSEPATESNSRSPPAPRRPTEVPAEVPTRNDVLHSIQDLRRALRSRLPAAGASSPPTALNLDAKEMAAASRLFADIGRHGMSTEELAALTGITADGTVTVVPAPTPPGTLPTMARRPTKRDQFSGITKVRQLLSPEKLVFSETDISPTSGNYGIVMDEIESALDSHDTARARTDRTTARMQSLIDAWGYLRDGDYDTMAERVMARMVKKAPSLADTPMTGTLHEEALAFMGMVGRAVMAFTNPEDTAEVTLEMGAKHAMFSVTESHYNALRDAFMEELPQFLPPNIYDATLRLWQTMWRVIIALFLSSVTSDRGACYAKRKHERWVSLVQKTMTEIVKREMGGPRDDRKHPFIMHMYDRGVAVDRKMKRYFLLREVRNCDRSMEAIIRIVTNLSDMSSVDPFLEELGFLHIEYGMTTSTLTTFRQPFLDTCAQYVGADAEYWNPDAIKAVGQLWDYISAKWAVGFTVNKKSMTNANAPDTSGSFCLIFTDIEGSTKLWENNRDVMCQAVKNHHRIVRALIADFDGYEVKTIGDSFMIACKDALIALKIAVGIQLEFMRTPTTQGFEMLKTAQGGGDPACWRSDAVRVRIGIHSCAHADAVYDSVQRRYDYYGTDVNLAARTEAAACGGQILMTEEAYNATQGLERFKTEPRHRLLAGISTTLEKGSDEYMKPFSDYITFADLGVADMKGIADPVHLFSATHTELAGRTFSTNAEMSTASGASSNAFGLLALDVGPDVDDGMDDVVMVKPLGMGDIDTGSLVRDHPRAGAH